MSGCCLKPDTGELLVVLNRTTPSDLPAIQVYSTNGVYRRTVTTVGFDDIESICQYRPESNLFALLEEGRSDISIVEIRTNTTSLSKSAATVIHMGNPYSNNLGWEGLTYDRTNDCFYVVKEKSPMAVYRVFQSNGTYRAETAFDAQTVFNGLCTDLSDVYYEPERGHLWILSQEGNRIFECDLSGRVIDTLPVPGANQPEGLTLTPDRQTLHVVGEPNEYFRYTRRPDHTVCAEGTNLAFTAVLSWPWTNTVSVEWSVCDSQATPWQDFTPATGLFSFAAGATSALLHMLVPIDMETEHAEGLALCLTNGCNALIGDDPRSTITIAANTSATLVVVSPFGIAVPPVGTNLFNVGMRTNCVVTGSPLYAGVLATQYVCNGWIASGSLPAQGLTAATPSVVLTTNSAIRWVWNTNAHLAFTAHGSGTVSAASGWYRIGTGIVAEASAKIYHHFTQWGGDLSAGADVSNAALPIAIDRPRAITADFPANLATRGTPEWWLAGIYGDTNDFDDLELTDTDRDGHAAWQEYRAGTDPTNAASVLRIAAIRRLTGGMQIAWSGVTGRTYRVYRQADLVVSGAVDIVASGLPGSTTGTVTDPATTGITGAFYRVLVE
jgi:uncharacterized protein YjiK